jgi:hypothetical protein
LRRGWGGAGGDEKEIAGVTSDIGQIQDTTTMDVLTELMRRIRLRDRW